MVSNLVLANNTVSLCFFLTFLTIDLHFLITQIYISTAELAIPVAIPSKEAKSEIEI